MEDIVIRSGGDARSAFYLPGDFDSGSRIWVAAEQVAAEIREEGVLSFLDGAEAVFARAELPPSEEGRGVYRNVKCEVKDNSLYLYFPRYRWIDHYPHCDGEHDRWSAVISGWQTVQLELSTRTVFVNGEKKDRE